MAKLLEDKLLEIESDYQTRISKLIEQKRNEKATALKEDLERSNELIAKRSKALELLEKYGGRDGIAKLAEEINGNKEAAEKTVKFVEGLGRKKIPEEIILVYEKAKKQLDDYAFVKDVLTELDKKETINLLLLQAENDGYLILPIKETPNPEKQTIANDLHHLKDHLLLKLSMENKVNVGQIRADGYPTLIIPLSDGVKEIVKDSIEKVSNSLTKANLELRIYESKDKAEILELSRLLLGKEPIKSKLTKDSDLLETKKEILSPSASEYAEKEGIPIWKLFKVLKDDSKLKSLTYKIGTAKFAKILITSEADTYLKENYSNLFKKEYSTSAFAKKEGISLANLKNLIYRDPKLKELTYKTGEGKSCYRIITAEAQKYLKENHSHLFEGKHREVTLEKTKAVKYLIENLNVYPTTPYQWFSKGKIKEAEPSRYSIKALDEFIEKHKKSK